MGDLCSCCHTNHLFLTTKHKQWMFPSYWVVFVLHQNLIGWPNCSSARCLPLFQSSFFPLAHSYNAPPSALLTRSDLPVSYQSLMSIQINPETKPKATRSINKYRLLLCMLQYKHQCHLLYN